MGRASGRFRDSYTGRSLHSEMIVLWSYIPLPTYWTGGACGWGPKKRECSGYAPGHSHRTGQCQWPLTLQSL